MMPNVRLGRLILTLLALVTGSVFCSMPVRADDEISAVNQQLADRFAPIAALRQQKRACDRQGEGYFPAPVETVLGNPEVALKQATTGRSATDPIVTMAPTAQDLAGKDDRFYLDFPGNPHRAGCTYESTFKRYAAQLLVTPTTYAHIVIDADSGQVVLQYWFWYYFNDWNNTHESDWEMIQLIFAATTVEEALTGEPELVGYAQHGGGETADWTDDKVQRDGDRPIVFPGAGSHGTYYGQDYYISWGENGTGFGCDNTTPPTTRAPLTVVVIPDDPDPAGPFGWLAFAGRWGERQTWEFNGPTGPNVGEKWSDPIAAMDHWRGSSLSVPRACHGLARGNRTSL